MEDLLYSVLFHEKIPENVDSKKMTEIDSLYYVELGKVCDSIINFFDKSPILKLYDIEGDDYGRVVCPNLEEIACFAHEILSMGDREVTKIFIDNPFESNGSWDLDMYLKRGSSCANSSCFYWNFKPTSITWSEILLDWFKNQSENRHRDFINSKIK
jgi:hypothetical protein